MPSKMSGYEKVINKCIRNDWHTFPPHESEFDYDVLYNLIKYRVNKIIIGITHHPKTWNEYYDLILEYNNFKRGVYLKKLIFVHGIETGMEIFENYKNKQAYTNTFEYKQIKYGISKFQFDEYNKSRAITIDNLIKKHGNDEGTRKYISYCERQAFTNSEEYLGKEKYKEVNRKKSHTLQTYVERYGELEGRSKLIEFYGKLSPNRSYSKISQECFDEVVLMLTEEENEKTYYATKNKEYCLIFNNKVLLYDFVCIKLKLCIEYHGDHYHGNPLTYRPDDYLKGRGCTKIKAKDKWETDKLKMEFLKSQRGCDTIVIWDSDWRQNRKTILENLKLQITKLRNNL